jgi:hypothetical protein
VTTNPRVLIFLLIAALGMGGALLSCDQVSRPPERQPPSVSGLEVIPDTFDAARLEPLPDQDSLVQDTLGISVLATDPDGQIARVVFTVEPASNPRATIAGALNPVNDSVYAGGGILTVPRFRGETFTVRVYAVDDDSLASNQGIGRLQIIPES